jgi:hypothetical protein
MSRTSKTFFCRILKKHKAVGGRSTDNASDHKQHEAIGFLLCCETNKPAKMSANPKKEESDKQKTEDVEIKIASEGTFAGTREKPILVKEGEPEPEDTADQGGGQN